MFFRKWKISGLCSRTWPILTTISVQKLENNKGEIAHSNIEKSNVKYIIASLCILDKDVQGDNLQCFACLADFLPCKWSMRALTINLRYLLVLNLLMHSENIVTAD